MLDLPKHYAIINKVKLQLIWLTQPLDFTALFMFFKSNILFVFFICLCSSLFSQNKSNRGKEFWLGYGFNYLYYSDPHPVTHLINHQELAIYISTIEAATVTVSINNTGWTQTLNIPANTVDATILIPKSGVNDARIQNEGVWNKGIHIVSNVDVAVYAHQYGNQASGATMLMPVETYGYLYYSVNYYQNTSGSSLPISPTILQNGPNWYSWFFVIASEDNTTVEITPADTTKNGWLPTQTYTITLNKGELYNVFGKLTIGNSQPWAASKDMTGSKVKSVVGSDGACHPIGVFSGSGGIRLCKGDGGEYMGQQIFPTKAWGTRYLTYHMMNNISNNFTAPILNFYRVCVLDPTTIVKRNGIVLTGLIKNFYYEFPSTLGDYIESDKPILVSQYTPNQNQCNPPFPPPFAQPYGDPEMIYLSPIEQGTNSVIYYTNAKSTINFIYTNIIVKSNAVNSLLADGLPINPLFVIPHPTNSLYSVVFAKADFTALTAQHSISCDSIFTAIVYGSGEAESYGYNIGCLVNNLNTIGEIKNIFSPPNHIDTFTCKNTPFRFVAKVAYRLSNIHWKLSQVTGLTPNADSIINNPIPIDSSFINNRKYFHYSLQQDFVFANPGTYLIPITYTAPDIDQCGNSESYNIEVIVKPNPTSDFSFTNPVCLKDTATLTGVATAAGFNITGYIWNFDDLTTQNTLIAKKRFTTAGNHNVRYRIIADNGCTGDTTKPVFISPSPIAKFGATSPICSNDSTRVTDTSSITTGTINSYRYFWGDGTNSVTNGPISLTHKYANAGTYIIKQITTSNIGCVSDTAYQTVVVMPSAKAIFGFDKNICLGDSIRFTDTSTISSGSIINYQWNMGDGYIFNQTTPTSFYHTYTATGNYIVTLTVTSNLGCISTLSKQVNVSAKPVATFSINGRGCVDSPFVFTSSYTPTPLATWRWSFGDGGILNTATGNTATHTYTLPQNNITVKHVVDIGGGCVSDTASLPILIIKPNPIANFSIIKDTVCENKPVKFTSTLNNINQWNWSFGNSTGNDAPPFTHIYTTAGTYNISLNVKDNVGCGSATVNDVLIVSPQPIVNAGADKLLLQGNSVLLDATINPTASYNYTWLPSTGLNATNILQATASPQTTTNYIIIASNSISKCTTSDTVLVQVFTKLYIPNTFTPNGDGKNDKWNIPALGLYPNAVVTIFNRYGQKIIEQKNYNSTNAWDGTFKGTKQPNGSYVYYIQLNNTAKEVYKGTVLVVR